MFIFKVDSGEKKQNKTKENIAIYDLCVEIKKERKNNPFVWDQMQRGRWSAALF